MRLCCNYASTEVADQTSGRILSMSEASGVAPILGAEKVCDVYCGEPAAEDRVGVGEVAAFDLPKAS